MNSSRTITLFADPPPVSRSPSSFLVSIVLHTLVMGLVYFGLKHAPRVTNQHLAQRYTVRFLNLHRQEPQLRNSAGTGAARPVPLAAPGAVADGGRPAPPSVPQQLAQRVPAPQTLVEPDLPPNLLLPKQVPIPLVLLWTPENTLAMKVVPPPMPKPAVANVRPSLTPPNQESQLADLKISSTAFVTEAPTLPPSTTSPLTVRGPEPVQQVPKTTSNSLEHPTPATVMALSDVLLVQGTIAVPLANQTAPQSSLGEPAPGRPENTPEAGNGSEVSKLNGSGAGQNPGHQGNSGEEKQETASTGGPAGENGAKPGPGQGSANQESANRGSATPGPSYSGAGSGPDNEPTITRLKRPKDGQFGVVVVGSSLAQEYPEMPEIWGGRLAYTVYINVGLPQSWILQYSLPRGAVAATASAPRPDAPWPYEIARPHLAPGDYDANAIMVHGFVTATGHFEKLAIVFPPEFSQAKFVLSALNQWQFRPAMQNGQLAAVEVLLIIPGELD